MKTSALQLSEEQASRFWPKVDIRGADDCWNWAAATNQFGYGFFGLDGGARLAHRVAYSLANGSLPPGLVVRHRCDNRLCCNPAHLELGTQAQNSLDALERGGRKLKLGAEQVEEIIRRYRAGEVSQRQLAEEFGVTQPHISKLIRDVYAGHGRQ